MAVVIMDRGAGCLGLLVYVPAIALKMLNKRQAFLNVNVNPGKLLAGYLDPFLDR
jgi:hypothetical protein